MVDEPCQQHQSMVDSLKKFEGKLDEILKRMGSGDVNFATIEVRLKFLEALVYGSLATSASALLVALLRLIIK